MRPKKSLLDVLDASQSLSSEESNATTSSCDENSNRSSTDAEPVSASEPENDDIATAPKGFTIKLPSSKSTQGSSAIHVAPTETKRVSRSKDTTEKKRKRDES